MSVSQCHLNVTYQHSFESEPKTQQIQTASGLDEDGIDWHDPGNGTWHNKHPETACRLCENKPDFQQVPLVRPFILQHCNMDPATNLYVWSQTNAQKQLEEKFCTDFR